MYRVWGCGILVFGLVSLAVAEEPLRGEPERRGYSIGFQVGNDFREQGVEINPEMLVRGLQDALEGRHGMSQQDMRKALVDLQRRVTSARERQTRQEVEGNLVDGRAFLEENKAREGVKALESGLQYRVIKEGSGASPGPEDTVVVHYRGRFVDGTEFDSSYAKGTAARFRVDRVIVGWREALQLMKEGSTWEIFVPSELAYGERRVGKIGPNSTLIFEIELLSVPGR